MSLCNLCVMLRTRDNCVTNLFSAQSSLRRQIQLSQSKQSDSKSSSTLVSCLIQVHISRRGDEMRRKKWRNCYTRDLNLQKRYPTKTRIKKVGFLFSFPLFLWEAAETSSIPRLLLALVVRSLLQHRYRACNSH